jgi:hypothetical protein
MLDVLRSACIISGTPIFPIGKKTEKRIYRVLGDTEIWPLFESYVNVRHKFLARWKGLNHAVACKLMEVAYSDKIDQVTANRLADLAEYLMDVKFCGYESLPPAPLLDSKDAMSLDKLLKKVGVKVNLMEYVGSYETEWNKLNAELRNLEQKLLEFRRNVG